MYTLIGRCRKCTAVRYAVHLPNAVIPPDLFAKASMGGKRIVIMTTELVKFQPHTCELKQYEDATDA